MTPKKIYKRLTLLPIVGLFLLVGCVNDDLSVCGVKVHFKYTRNVANFDRLADDITKVNFYIFDIEGILVDEYTIEQNPMPEDLTIYLNLEPGTYDFVAWGDLKDSYVLSPAVVKGITTRSELEVQLKSALGSTTIDELPSNLYYGSIEQYQVTSHDLLTQRDTVIDFIKNTKEITVIAHGLAIMGTRTAGTAYECGVSTLDCTLKFDNYTIGDDTLNYIPDASIVEDSLLVSRFVIVRDHGASAIYRSPQSRLRLDRTDEDGVPHTSLVDVNLYPLLVAAASLEPIYVSANDQKVDIKDKYQIDIYFDETYGTASIYIEGWQVNATDDPVYNVY